MAWGGQGPQPFHIVDIKIAHAPVTDESLRAQAFEAGHRRGKRVIARPVQQIKVEIVEPQPLQAACASCLDASLAGVVRVDLGDDEEIFAAHRARQDRGGDGLPHHAFGPTLAIHLSRIHEAITNLKSAAQGAQFLSLATRVLAHAPGTESEHGNGLPVGEICGPHCVAPLLACPVEPWQSGRPHDQALRPRTI